MRYHEIVEGVNSRMLKRHGNKGTPFEVLHHDPLQHTQTRPLIIIVHPGDLIEPPDGWSHDRQAYKHVREFSMNNQAGTARDIKHWRDNGADVVILHRESCSQFGDRSASKHVCYDLSVQVRNSWKNGTVLFGDDLDAAAKWIIDNLHVQDRPRIYLAGAYSHPDHGCLTFIGKAMEAVVGADKIKVSSWSPPGNAPGEPWRPQSEITEDEKQISDVYLYHGTSKRYLDTIKHQGLVPRTKLNMRRGRSHTAHSLGRVFFADTVEKAEFYALRRAGPLKFQRILRVRRDALPNMQPDQEADGCFFVDKAVPPDQIEFWNGKNWVSVTS